MLVSSNELTTDELLRTLSDDPRVVFAEPNYVYQLAWEENGSAELHAQGALEASAEGAIGDLTPLVWGNWTTDLTTRNAGTTANPSINVPAYGSDQIGANMDKQIVVALLDTGVDYTRPELKDVIYQFSSDERAALGCSQWGYNAIGRGQNGKVIDRASIAVGHGTHTAGTIGASWDGKGMSGVAFNVKIVAITLANSNGQESLADAVCAFDFVNRFNEQQASDEKRIKLTSNSWSEYMSSRALDAVVRELGDTWGVVSFFSSGNDSGARHRRCAGRRHHGHSHGV